MAFNREDYVSVKKEYEAKRAAARERAELRLKKVRASIPGRDGLCAEIDALGPKMYEAALQGREGREERFAEVRRRTEYCVKEREKLLVENGYPADYLDVHFECPVCRDEGNVDGAMCECMRKRLVIKGYESAGISGLCGKMSFDNFDLSYYKGEDRRNMEVILRRVREYADNFNGRGSGSLLFLGGTGLGKTHLSVAVAKTVVERGYYVYYCTAEKLFSDFRYERFRRNGDDSPIRTDKYTECDLLVIDDLGTESSGKDVTAFFYSLLNARVNTGMSTVISTNLSHKEMLAVYDERIASRLFGEFFPYLFTGRDIRMQKLQEG